MPVYENADAVYEELGGVLRTVLANAERRDALQRTDAVVQFVLTDPDAVITCLARAGAPPAVGTGPTEVPIDLTLAMPADTARALLFGERPPVAMLAAGEIALKGPADRLLRVLDALVGASEVTAEEQEADSEPATPAEEPEETGGTESAEETAESEPAEEAAEPEPEPAEAGADESPGPEAGEPGSGEDQSS